MTTPSALCGLVVERKAAIVEVMDEGRPTRPHVSESGGERGFTRELGDYHPSRIAADNLGFRSVDFRSCGTGPPGCLDRGSRVSCSPSALSS
jgi:hypothetical protein